MVNSPNVSRTINCKALNSPVEYPSGEYKHDTKESEGRMFNPIFNENVQGRKHPGSRAFAEPELFIYRTPKCSSKLKRTTIKIPIIVTTIMKKVMMK